MLACELRFTVLIAIFMKGNTNKYCMINKEIKQNSPIIKMKTSKLLNSSDDNNIQIN